MTSDSIPRRLMVGIWMLVVSVGMATLIDYSSRPGDGTRSATVWPTESRLFHAPDRNTLLVFLHPHCPCSRATVRQLNRILSSTSFPVAVRTVFFCPREHPSSWTEGDIWRTVQSIRDSVSVVDWDGLEASRFGVATSGHVLLFRSSGICSFSGGITSGRGHEGACGGDQAVLNLLRNNEPGFSTFPVFGCPLTHVDEA